MSEPGGGGGESAAAGFSKSVAGIPAWGWGLVVVAALAISYYLRRRSTAAAMGAAQVGGITPSGAAPSSSGPPTSGVAASDISPYLDNNSWGVAAQTALLQSGGADPVTIDSAVRDYLAGDTLTPDESALIGRALRLVGPTPEVLSPVYAATSLTDPGVMNTDTPGSPVPTMAPSSAPAPLPEPAPVKDAPAPVATTEPLPLSAYSPTVLSVAAATAASGAPVDATKNPDGSTTFAEPGGAQINVYGGG